MKKLISTLSFVAVTLGSVLAPTSALADNSFGKGELQKSACLNTVGAPVINVEQKVKNDADSGVAGNNWALDNYKREIVVYKTQTANTFCATVRYDGGFVTFAGASPQNTGTVGAGVKGDMNGGYRGIITGSLKASPTWKTHGNVGTFDYACDVLGNCPGRVSWLNQYFDAGYGFNYAWWGWQYTSKHNGNWINAATGNSGDITGTAVVKGHGDHDGHDDHEENDD